MQDFDTYKSSERSNEPGHLQSLARAFTTFTHIQETYMWLVPNLKK